METNRCALRAFCCKKALMVALGSLPTQPVGIAGWQAVAGLQAFPPTDSLDNVDSGCVGPPAWILHAPCKKHNQ